MVTKPAAMRGVGAAALVGLMVYSASGGANGLGDVADGRAAGAIHAPARQMHAPARAIQAPIVLAQAGGSRPVSWSDIQASRGEKLFKEVCADCHGASLRGGLIGGPPLTGSAFAQKFLNGTPASALFLFNSTLMPPDSPGQYSPGEYVDLTAFILRENGIDSSGAPMPSNPTVLDQMIVEK